MNEQSPLRIPLPADESARLSALNNYQILDTDRELDFDLLADLAAELCQAPYAFISLVDANRVWYKSARGREVLERPRDDDYCAWTLLEDRLLHIPDLTADPRTAGMAITHSPPHYRMYCGANLVAETGYRLGVLCVLDTRQRTLPEAQQQMLARLARLVVALMELRARDRDLKSTLAAMHQLAFQDSLTGMLNRHALMDALEQEVMRSQRFKSRLALLMLDLDHFKQVNDRFGHAMGDAVLRGVGRVVRSSIRAIDIPGRYGGEEMCIILPGTDLAGGIKAAESLRRAIAAAQYRDGERSTQVTASIGVCASEQMAFDADALLRGADAALYMAKQAGRNQVMPTAA